MPRAVGVEKQRERLRSVNLSELAKQYDATFVHVISDDAEAVRALLGSVTLPMLVSTWKPEVRQELTAWRDDLEVVELGHELTTGINALNQIRDVVLAAYVEGYFASTDRVLALARIGHEFEMVLYFDMRYDESVTRLKKELEYRADLRVIETVLQLASELAREGREAGHTGALFVVGDTSHVMEVSRQIVINPFQGHPPEARNMLDPATWETAKEFSQIDGAFIIHENGIIEACGRYIDVKHPVSLPSGLGGRHLAAAAVSKETKAISIVVSETGVIRIFKDGDILLRIGTT